MIPFISILAVNGLRMLWIAALDWQDAERIPILPQAVSLAISAQADAALATARIKAHGLVMISPVLASLRLLIANPV